METCSFIICSREASFFYFKEYSVIYLCRIHGKNKNDLVDIHKALSETQISLLNEARSKFNQIICEISYKLNEHSTESIADKYRVTSQTCADKIHMIDHCLANMQIKNMLNDELLRDLYKNTGNSDILVNHAIVKSIIQVQDYNFVTENFLNMYKPSKLLYYFERKSKELSKIDCQNHTFSRLNIDTLPIRLGQHSGICELEDMNLFCCGGGYCNFDHDKCFMINPVTSEWEELPSMPYRNRNISPLQIGNFVYVFGGWKYKDPRIEAIRYSFNSRCWEFIPSMPFHSPHVNAVPAFDSIVLAGVFSNGVYLYCLKNRIYTKILDDRNSFRALIGSSNGDLYYISNRCIYKSSIFDYNSWTHLANVDIKESINGTSFVHCDRFYFTSDSGTYLFNLYDKSVRKIQLSNVIE